MEIDWVGYTALAAASGVSCTDITLVFDHEHDSMQDCAPQFRATGRLAVAAARRTPLLTFVEQRGVSSWRLGGIIYESSSLILKASRADCLNSDATINRYPDPMAYRQG